MFSSRKVDCKLATKSSSRWQHVCHLQQCLKMLPQVSKGIAKLANNGDIASVKSALSKLDNCVGQLEGLVESCEGPAVMALSMIPNVGSVVGFVCA